MSKKNIESSEEILVVGIGASAGGLKPLKKFFATLPEKTGMAFIVIVHLSPKHESNLAEILQQETSLSVEQVKKETEIKEDCIFVIPPGKLLKIEDSYIELLEPDGGMTRTNVIDQFFRSLGMVKGKRSVGIVLSGTGNDGTIGLKTIKEQGGLVFAQEPAEAEYDGMPQSAINMGLVDKVLPVEAMAKELISYQKSFSDFIKDEAPESLSESDERLIVKILARVQAETTHDFSHYKRSTVQRRIKRRMHVNHVDNYSAYLRIMQRNPDEAEALFKDLLISVTNFFRDPETFQALEKQVIPRLFEGRDSEDDLRIWVPGCATGEEAYSIGMLLLNYARTVDFPPQIQIFATDVDEDALKVARRGYYPESITTDVSEQQLKQFFIKESYEYQVRDELRDIILFAKHNLLGSPPFSNLDLISCRNLLIYLDKDLQVQVFNLFHYALKSKGFLFLGKSDSNLEAPDLFIDIDSQNRIFQRSTQANKKDYSINFPIQTSNDNSLTQSWKVSSVHTKTNFEQLHQRLIIRDYGPASIIINENNDVLHACGDIQNYLSYKSGEPSRNVLDMVNSELIHTLRNLLHQAREDSSGFPFSKQVWVDSPVGGTQLIEMNLHRIDEKKFPDGLKYVVFRKLQDIEKKEENENTARENIPSNQQEKIIKELENELKYTKDQLKAMVEDYETSNEELRASNEELQSMNEELQLTTEERETSQEELQSVNEELKTVNQELESKIEKLSRANNDLKNLMDASEVAIIFLDADFKLKRFTNAATKIFNLTRSYIDRPFGHFTNRLQGENIMDDIRHVFETHESYKKQVVDREGRYYIMRLSLYKTVKDEVGGIVLTLVDITEMETIQQELANKIEEINNLHREILKINVNERWKVGQYLHDEFSQLLVAANMTVEHIKNQIGKDDSKVKEGIDKLGKLIRQSIDEVRNLSHEILPVDVEQEGIRHAFQNLVKDTEEKYSLSCTLDMDSVVDEIEDIDFATNLYRIAREAVKNAVLHSDAKHVNITFRSENDDLIMEIEDDGGGFDIEEIGNGMGINIMKHRMEIMNGSLEIKASNRFDKKGTLVLCKMPLNSKK